MSSKKSEVKEYIRMKVQQVVVDRTQYKPYTSILTSDKLFVDIPLEEFEAAEVTQDDEIVLTLDGLAGIMVKVADAITTADDKARQKRFGH